MSVDSEKQKLFNRERIDEPLKYWVRERPAGARGDMVDHYVVLYGPRGCSYGALPFQFKHWEVAQTFANALEANRPTEGQVRKTLIS